MKPETWSKLEAQFSRFPIMKSESVPRAEVDSAAAAIDTHFESDYIEFVKRYGAGMVGSYPIFGLRMPEVMGRDFWSVVDVTNRFRKEGWKGASDWYIISMDGAGNPIGIAKDGKVWISDHNAGQIYILASSFEEFLDSCLVRPTPTT